MTSNDTGGHARFNSHPRPAGGTVDFTLMYAAHDAFHRDLRRLTAAAEAGRTADPGLRAGWATFKNQLHIHHTAEDTSLLPPLRHNVTRPEEAAVLDAMEAEHARIGPLLDHVDASLAAAGGAGLAGSAGALADALAGHMEHEEAQALPLVEAYLGPEGWAAFRKAIGKSQGLRGGAEFFPWMLDGAPAGTSKRVLGMLPLPPASSTGRYGAPATPAPHAGTPPKPDPRRKATTMKLTTFGATGATGTWLAEQTLTGRVGCNSAGVGARADRLERDPTDAGILVFQPPHYTVAEVTRIPASPADGSPAPPGNN